MSKKKILIIGVVALLFFGFVALGVLTFLKSKNGGQPDISSASLAWSQKQDDFRLDNGGRLPRSPMFKDVKRVYIEVTYHVGLKKILIPDVLAKENIEKLLLDMFSARFSKSKCNNARQYGLERDDYEYDCNDQPVKIATADEASAYYEYTYGRDPEQAKKYGVEEVIAPGSLYIKFELNFQYSRFDYLGHPSEDPVVAYFITMVRPGDGRFMAYPSSAYSILQDTTAIEEKLRRSILNRLTL